MDEAAAAKHLEAGAPACRSRTSVARSRNSSAFDRVTLETELRAVADRAGVKPGTLIHATRVAVTGRAVSPGLFEVLELLGPARVLDRLDAALRRLEPAGWTSAADRAEGNNFTLCSILAVSKEGR